MTDAGKGVDLRALCELVARLRGPDGCPWDREQGLADLRPYLLEEAHEVASAIDSGEWAQLEGELGDLLFQVAFLIRLGEEEGETDLETVVRRIHQKMVDRHPHVFGGSKLSEPDEVRRAWEKRKLSERGAGESIFSGLPRSLPALVRAHRMTQKAAGVGFDWTSADQVLDKIDEELAEVRHELAEGGDRIEEEVGDLLFSITNLARHLGLDAEAVLARASDKFQRRFDAVQSKLHSQGGKLEEASPSELEAVWQQVKSAEE